MLFIESYVMRKFSFLIYVVVFVGSLSFSSAKAQDPNLQRVERYLYTIYNSNKSSIRETERLMRSLEERMDLYLVTLSRDDMKLIKDDDQKVDAYVKQMERLTSVKVIRQTIEEGKVSYRETLDRLLNEGLKNRADVLECRKILVLRSMEYNLQMTNQDKLLLLLKDDFVRQEFIQKFVVGKSEDDFSNLKIFAKQVDMAIDAYDM